MEGSPTNEKSPSLGGSESHQGDQTAGLLPVWGAWLNVIKKKGGASYERARTCRGLAVLSSATPDLLTYRIHRHGGLKVMQCTVHALECQN